MKNIMFRDKAYQAVIGVLLTLIFLAAAYPMYYVLLASFSNPNQLATGQIWLFPKGVFLDGYKRIVEYPPLWLGYRNTIFYTLGSVAASLLVTIPAAYAMSRREFMPRNIVMIYFVITMFFSGGLIPTYLVIKDIGLLDNPWVMILPTCFGVYNMIIARTFFQTSIPADLHDAASIDGCGEARFFLTIVLPLSKAILAVITLYCAVGAWNSYFNGMLYLQNNNYKPLQVVLRDILIVNSFNERQTGGSNTSALAQLRMKELVKYCVIVVSTAPIMCVYPLVQKHFTQGVMIGAIKG